MDAAIYYKKIAHEEGSISDTYVLDVEEPENSRKRTELKKQIRDAELASASTLYFNLSFFVAAILAIIYWSQINYL